MVKLAKKIWKISINSGLNAKKDDEKINILCYLKGEKSDEILSQILPNVTDATNCEEVKKGFNEYCTQKERMVWDINSILEYSSKMKV